MTATSTRTKKSSTAARKRTSSDSRELLRRCRGHYALPQPLNNGAPIAVFSWVDTARASPLNGSSKNQYLFREVLSRERLLAKVNGHGEVSFCLVVFRPESSSNRQSPTLTPFPSPTETSSKSKGA